MIGLLTYLPTTAYIPQFFFLITFFFVLIRDREIFLSAFSDFRQDSSHPINWNFLIIVLIIVFSFINRFIHWDSLGKVSEMFPYFILLIPTYVIAVGFRKSDAVVLVSLVGVEAIIVILESYFGVSTFDSSLAGFIEFDSGGLAYFQRPLGLSSSSSHIASKLLLSWLMIDFFKFKHKLWWLVKAMLLMAIVLTFNRSVLLSLGVYLMLFYTASFLDLKYKLENAVVGFIAGVIGFISVTAVVILKGQDLISQLTRNTGKIELTGREFLWADFWVFIQDHLVFGNNSVKLWLDGYHAHNSYIEVIATNGVLITLLYFLLIYRNVKKSNWVYVLPILVFGITQYGFFWGISLMDILFYVILFKAISNYEIESLNPLPIEPILSRKQLKGSS